MLDLFRDLFFMHAELALPPVPISHPHHFPPYLLPTRATEERPGVHAEYEKILSRFISANQTAAEDEEAEMDLKIMDEVEPEPSLMNWAGEVTELVRSTVRVWPR